LKNLSIQKESFYQLIKEGIDLKVGYLDLDSKKLTGRYVHINGKKKLYFANCSYLGLETDSRLIEAAKQAASNYGIILSNSRAFLSSPLYKELESYINKIIPGHSIITTTTSLGHCSTLPAIIDKDDLIILDFHVHNSVKMGANLCAINGTDIKYLRSHNDMEYLRRMVDDPENDNYKRIWFLGDGIYSMQGEFLDLKGLKKVLNYKENLFAYIDDAHGFGWIGKNGSGYITEDSEEIHLKIISAVSMCKSFGTSGGIITFPNKELKDRVNTIGQTQIFSAPITNPVLGASIASAKLFLTDELSVMQGELLELILYFRKRCKESQIPLKTKSITPIQFIEIGDSVEVYKLGVYLLEKGIYCSLAVYPAVRRKHGGFRVSISRHLKKEDIDYLVTTLEELI